MSEIELKPVTDVTVAAWRAVHTFTAWEAACLLADYEPPSDLFHYTQLPRFVEKLAKELLKYPHTGGNTWNGWIFREVPHFQIKNPEREDAVFSREVLMQFSTENELKPKFLVHAMVNDEPTSSKTIEDANPDNEGIMLYRLLAAMAIDYGYDPSPPNGKQGNGIMQGFQKMLQKQEWPDKQDRIKDALELAVKKSGWKPRKS